MVPNMVGFDLILLLLDHISFPRISLLYQIFAVPKLPKNHVIVAFVGVLKKHRAVRVRITNHSSRKQSPKSHSEWLCNHPKSITERSLINLPHLKPSSEESYIGGKCPARRLAPNLFKTNCVDRAVGTI